MLWALERLDALMGLDWLERYFDQTGHVSEEVNLGPAHVVAAENLLDMALRYHVLDGRPGIAKVRNLNARGSAGRATLALWAAVRRCLLI